MNRKSMVSALAAVGIFAAAGAANAQSIGVCSTSSLAPGADFFEVEGPVASYDLATRTINVLGAPVKVPATMLLDVGGGEHRTMEEVFGVANDPKIVGKATVIAVGTAQKDAAGCIIYVANTAVEFLYAEHVTVGPLTSVNVAASTFSVNDVPIVMNTDPRVPSQLLDASGNPEISLADLANFPGTITGAEGYIEEDGILKGVIIETEAHLQDGRPVLMIENARYDEGDNEVRVGGFITPIPQAKPGTTLRVEIYRGERAGATPTTPATNALDAGTCKNVGVSGKRLGTVGVLADEAGLPQVTFTFRAEPNNDGSPENGYYCARLINATEQASNHRTARIE